LELAIERVKMRVSDGGHDIPEDTIRKRYKSGIANLIKMYIPVCDYWMVLNNSITPFQMISEGLHNYKIEIKEKVIWDKIIKQAHE
jgi:predicted ABC-type ATPase